jgi:hypothetical protein
MKLPPKSQVYDIEVDHYHNFCVSKHDILVHNFLPAITFGLAWAFGGGVVFEGLTLGLGAGIIGLAYSIAGELSEHTWDDHKYTADPANPIYRGKKIKR